MARLRRADAGKYQLHLLRVVLQAVACVTWQMADPESVVPTEQCMASGHELLCELRDERGSTELLAKLALVKVES